MSYTKIMSKLAMNHISIQWFNALVMPQSNSANMQTAQQTKKTSSDSPLTKWDNDEDSVTRSQMSSTMCCGRSSDFKLKWCKWLQSLNRRYQIYVKGKYKLDKELSVVAFVKMQHMLKILVRLMLNKQQRLIASYNKQNKISVSSASNDNQSDSLSDQRIPKMLYSSNTKQEHIEAVTNFIEKYSQNNFSLNDCKLLNWVFSNTDLDLKLQSININNNFYNQLENRINNIDQSQQLVSRSLNLRNISSIKLLEKYEEQKRYSPKSSLSVCKLIQETNQGKVDCFDEMDVH